MKRSTPLRYLSLSLAVLLTLTALAQPKNEQSLLWRITGNGLAKPSWLYGTIHLTDKQVFDFGDSLYAALERCEGYAMEVSPDSIVNKALREMQEDSSWLKAAVSAADFNRMRNKLQAEFKKDPELITVKEFKRHFLGSLTKADKNSMHTFMDAWFYDAMRRQGKWVGGVEDVADQEGMDEINSLKEYVDDFLDDNRKNRQMLNKMIVIYRNQDLQGVAELEEGKEMLFSNIMLRRNNKMARRMDSLAHIRSTFFAVGAGHLPGDSGVIRHLRRRGYTVEPIYSSKTMPASAYRFEEKELPWNTIEASNGLFRVQMPGEAQDMKLPDERMEMKMHIDIGTNLIYIAFCNSGNANFSIDSVVAQSIRNIAQKAKVESVTPIKKDSVEGREVIARGDEAVYRLQCFYRSPVVYVVMVASPIDTIIRSKDAERFLQSLVMRRKTPSVDKPWSAFRDDKMGFSVLLPTKPTVNPQKDNANSTMLLYASPDNTNDIYYQVAVESMKKGYFLEKDTAFFAAYREILANNKDNKILSHSYGYTGEYPVMWSEFMRNGFYNQVMRVHRGNRAYYLVATTADSAKHRQLLNNFFQSFTLQPIDPGKWQLRQAPDNSFSMWSATPITRYIDTTGENTEGESILYEIYDPSAPATYYLRKESTNPYTWYKSDTAFLRQMVKNTMEYADSIYSYEPVTNGPYTGVEVVLGVQGNHIKKKLRLIVVGDSVFTLYGVTSRQLLEQEDSKRLYADFTVTHHTPSTIFRNKARELFTALRSGDSLTFAQAKEAISLVSFTKDELPGLQEAITYAYQDSADYNNVTKLLQRELAVINDESTLRMVEKVWRDLPADREVIRYDLLDLLVDHQTEASVRLSRDLIMQRPPARGKASYYFLNLADSLQLVAPLLPTMLPLLNDSLAAPHLVALIEKLIDSSLIDLALLTSWKPQLYQLANNTLDKVKKNGNMSWLTDPSLIRLLGKLNDPAAYQLVNRFQAQADLDMKFIAVTTLLKGKRPVSPAALLALATDLGQRNDLYRLLADEQKTALFPLKFRTQRALAESELYLQAVDDYEDAKLTFLGERTIVVKGVSQVYYLFKVEMGNEDEHEVHLGIAGPYKSKAVKLVTEGGRTGIYWSKDYNANTVSADFKEALKEWEEYEQRNN